MKDAFQSLKLSWQMIIKDPINLMLALIPTLISLFLYLVLITAIFKNLDVLAVSLREYIHNPEGADIASKILMGIMIVFIFFIMSWTFVIVVGIISAPFNSMLSKRIEKKLSGSDLSADKSKTLQEIAQGLGQIFKNELKKLIFIVALGIVAVLLNFFPLFYPVAMLLFAALLAIQFIDYSWSRNNMHFGACMKDLGLNFIPYAFSGFFFLMLVSVPIINALVPAWATSYFTVLWLHRQNRIQAS